MSAPVSCLYCPGFVCLMSKIIKSAASTAFLCRIKPLVSIAVDMFSCLQRIATSSQKSPCNKGSPPDSVTPPLSLKIGFEPF